MDGLYSSRDGMSDGPVVGRRFARLKIDLPVDLVKAGDRRTVYTRDLSAGGFLFVADEPVPPGDGFTAFLDLATESEVLKIPSAVRHCRPIPGSWRHQVGVEFVGIDEFTRAKIQRFIERFQELQKAPKEMYHPLGLDDYKA